MSFLRHQEIFPSDGGAGLAASAPAHRLDEFPAGYSSAGCSPAEPASASPAEYDCALKSSCRSRSFHRTACCVLTVCVSRGGKRITSLNAGRSRFVGQTLYRSSALLQNRLSFSMRYSRRPAGMMAPIRRSSAWRESKRICSVVSRCCPSITIRSWSSPVLLCTCCKTTASRKCGSCLA